MVSKNLLNHVVVALRNPTVSLKTKPVSIQCQAADFKEASVNSEELDSVAINGHLIWRELTGEPV